MYSQNKYLLSPVVQVFKVCSLYV